MNNQRVQQQDQAHHTKLTAVTLGHGRNKVQFFAMLHHDEKGQAKLPHTLLDQQLNRIGCTMRGQTFTSG